MHEVLTLPEAAGPSIAPAQVTVPGDAEAVAQAVARLSAQHGLPGPEAAVVLGAETGRYAAAAAALEAGRVGEAVTLLAASAGTPGGRADAILGLAVCAARLACYDDALVLAGESRRLAPDHPRASCVAGLCEIERGNPRAAQGYLAAAARIARRHPAHREDLRMAQRMLLLMHLS